MAFKILACLCLLVGLGADRSNVDANRSRIQNRIISGRPAALGQFPWQVILKLDSEDELLCGGSIIASNWVLTAAHCTYGQTSMFLMFGTVTLNNLNAVNMTSTQLFVHPHYDHNNLNNDVSLIQLPEALNFSESIKPIRLISRSYAKSDLIGQVAVIAGFGLMDDENMQFSNSLMYAFVEVLNNSQCVGIYGKTVVIDSTLCAGGENGTDMSICSGDSGGPLVALMKNGSTYAEWMQIGINSFVAEDMCTEGYPSGYARLTAFLGYISHVTGIDFYNV